MVGTSSGNAANTTPSELTIGPNQQAVFLMDYDPRTVNVSNTSDFDGQFVFVWIYPSATAVTPTVQPIASQANVTLPPVARDGNGNNPKTIVIFNTSGVQLTCTERKT